MNGTNGRQTNGTCDRRKIKFLTKITLVIKMEDSGNTMSDSIMEIERGLSFHVDVLSSELFILPFISCFSINAV